MPKPYDEDPLETNHPNNVFDSDKEVKDFLKLLDEEKQKGVDKAVKQS